MGGCLEREDRAGDGRGALGQQGDDVAIVGVGAGHFANDVAVAPAEKLRQIARKLSQLADDSLLCLRLEVSTSHELMIGLRGIWICVCSIVTASFNPIFDLTRLGSPIVSLRYTCW